LSKTQIFNCYICQLEFLFLILLQKKITTQTILFMFINRQLKKFLDTEFQSTARIIDPKTVEVISPDGEIYYIISQIGRNLNEKTRKYELHVLEYLFDKCHSEDKEEMVNNVWREAMLNGISIMGISPGNRQQERVRIGTRIKQIREERGIEARELAKLAGIDAANLSRIENGKYSVGIDILSKIAAALGKKIDLVDIN